MDNDVMEESGSLGGGGRTIALVCLHHIHACGPMVSRMKAHGHPSMLSISIEMPINLLRDDSVSDSIT